MSIPLLDYVPCDLVAYHETVQPALCKAWRGDFQPLRSLMASARHVSYWPVFNIPSPLPALSVAGPSHWLSSFSATEPFWPQFLATGGFWSCDRHPHECLPAEFFTNDYLDLWERFSSHFPAIFDTHATLDSLDGLEFLRNCLFYTLCCWRPTEEMVDSREIVNGDLSLGRVSLSHAGDPGPLGWL